MLNNIRQLLFSDKLKSKHRTCPQAFSRARKLPFPVLVLFIANFVKGSLQDELDQCFQAVFKLDVAVRFVTRSAVSKARRNLSHRVFIDLLHGLGAFINQHAQLNTCHGRRVFAIDGSTFRVPNRTKLVLEFGHTNTSKNSRAIARISILHDVLNRITYDAIIQPYSVTENVMAYQHLDEADIPAGSLIVLDRNYVDGPS